MGERVTLTYTVDIDELEEEVNRLYSAATNILGQCIKGSKKAEKMLTLDAYEDIDVLRQELSIVDTKLQEINSIINGYLSYQTQLNARNHTPAQTVNEDTD